MATFRGKTITQPFGVRNSAYRLGYHPGVDLDFKLGERQPAYRGGIANFQADNGGGYGNTGTVRYDNGDVEYHAHLAANGLLVPQGSRVNTGQSTFITGNTGWIDGVHEHLEVRLAGNQDRPVDPVTYLGENQDMPTLANKGDVSKIYDLALGRQPYDYGNNTWIDPGAAGWVGLPLDVVMYGVADSAEGQARRKAIAEKDTLIQQLQNIDKLTKGQVLELQAKIATKDKELTELQTKYNSNPDTALLNEGKPLFGWLTKLINRLKGK